MPRLLWLLRVLIVCGALAGILQTQTNYHLARFSLVNGTDTAVSLCGLDQRSVVKLALTMVSLSLL